MLTDRSRLTADRDFGGVGMRSWRLADLGAKHALMLAGIGRGSPIRDDLVAGRLKRLDLAEECGGPYGFHAIYRPDAPPGPAALWMIRRFAAQSA